MRRIITVVLALAIVASMHVVSAPAADAHRAKCLPGRLNHRQCHRLWRKARSLGYGPRYIRRHIFRHEKRVAAIMPSARTMTGGCIRGCAQFAQAKADAEQGARVRPGSMVYRHGTRAYSLIFRATLWRAGITKKWCWNRRAKLKPLSKCGYVTPFHDVTSWGAFGWEYKGIQDRYDRMRNEHTAHTTMRQPKFRLCGSFGWPCVRDVSPRIYLTSWVNAFNRGVNSNWVRC